MYETVIYKITRSDLTTHNGYQWVIGETREFPGTGDLCGPGYAYAYESAQLALLLKFIHVDYDPYCLLRGRGVIVKRDGQLKAGCSRLTLLERITVPDITLEQRVTFAVLSARAVHTGNRWASWAERWLDGTDRSAESAEKMERAVAALVRTRWMKAATRAWEAEAARRAADSARWAADSARAAERGVQVAARAARAAQAAVHAAQAAGRSLNLAVIAREALLPWEPEGGGNF